MTIRTPIRHALPNSSFSLLSNMTNTVRAEVITIGDEILFGQITDTNTAWIGTELTNIGIRVVRKTSVGDQADAILQSLQEAHQRADIIIITGGLGPTKDDITKKTLCTYFGVGMVRNETALALVTGFFEKRGREMTDLNRASGRPARQCRLHAERLGNRSRHVVRARDRRGVCVAAGCTVRNEAPHVEPDSAEADRAF